MSGTVKRVAVRLALEGADPVRAQLNAVGQTGEQAFARVRAAAAQSTSSFGGVRNAIGQAGFQIQDFAVQVQSGTSALTALSQQGSQFLGLFGPAGAIAGAGLVVGALAAQFLGLSRATDDAARAQEGLQRALDRSIEFFETATERAARLNAETRAGIFLGFAGQARAVTEQITEVERALQTLEADRARIIGANRNLPNFNPDTVLRDPIAQNIARLRDLRTELEELDRQRERALTAPSGADRQGAEQAGRPRPGGGGRSAGETSLNEALRERDQILRSLEGPYEQYLRRTRELDALNARLPANQRLTDEQLTRARERLTADLDRIDETTRRSDGAARELGLTFTSAFEDALVKGRNLREVLQGMAADIARIITRRTITEPFGNAVSSVLGGIDFGKLRTSLLFGAADGGAKTNFTPSANGNIFAGGNVVPFARGGVVDSPTFFPMANGGVGLMGEAGPEAIMPLQRDSSGRLGVRASGGGGIHQVINVDARGADGGVDVKIRAAIAVATDAANRRLLEQINRGGSVAKQVGRR